MEIRDISSIYELKNYIENNNEESFVNIVLNEQKKYHIQDYKKFKENYLKWKKQRDGLIKYLAYKYWFIARIPTFIRHRIKKINNPRSFYDIRFFHNRYKQLAYPIIEDCNNSKFEDTAINLYNNIDNYEKTWELLEDKKSKEVLLEILKCRLTRSIDCIINIYEEEKIQYFDAEIIGRLKNEVFIDAGGYIGDTSEMFLNKCENIKKTYIYEPNIKSIKLARKRLIKYLSSNIRVIYKELGLSNTETDVKFLENGGSSRIIHGDISNSRATEIIRLVTLDDDVEEKVTFIKMDIEGEESKALEGSKLHIQNNSPKLAICVYHKFDDLWKLPLQINSYNQNYKMYLRHYDKTRLAETVLYCIPK